MIYRRSFDAASGDSLARLSRWIRPGATVLELGAAAGYFTEWLQQQGATVDVVDIDPDAGLAAEPFARRVVVADLDADGWETALAGGGSTPRYDFIVCADVLLLTAHCDAEGRRRVLAKRLAAVSDVAAIVSTFGARIDAAPGAWHFWHFLPAYSAPTVQLQALP